jgi:hypothetical protein
MQRPPKVASDEQGVRGVVGVVGLDDQLAARGVVAGRHVLDEHAKARARMNRGGKRVGHDLEVQALLVAFVLLVVVVVIVAIALVTAAAAGAATAAATVGAAIAAPVTVLLARAERFERHLGHVEVALANVADRDSLQSPNAELDRAEVRGCR